MLKFPKPLLIEAIDKDSGDVVLVSKGNSKEFKGYGFVFLLYQTSLGIDSADNYSALSHLNKNLNFGDSAAYKVLKPCKTAKEALQATINTFAELLPHGVQYTDHTGKEWDVPTIEYMNTYFHVAYMLRSADDNMDFYKLCKLMEVDTSAIEDNNKLTPPVKTFVAKEELTEDIKSVIVALLDEKLKSYKSKKKGELVEVLDEIKETLTEVSQSFDGFYEMRQFEKENTDGKD